MEFELQIQATAIIDIQEAIDYYDFQRLGLGEESKKEVNNSLTSLICERKNCPVDHGD